MHVILRERCGECACSYLRGVDWGQLPPGHDPVGQLPPGQSLRGAATVRAVLAVPCDA